jgi:hypothetical protein
MKNQPKEILVISKNNALLNAFYQTCIDVLNFPMSEVSKTWNEHHKDLDMLCIGQADDEEQITMEFHNHTCRVPEEFQFNLPEEWNQAMKHAKSIIEHDDCVDPKIIKKSGLKIGDKGIFEDRKYCAESWGRDSGWSNTFSDGPCYVLVDFKMRFGVPCAVVSYKDEYSSGGKYYFPLSQFEDCLHTITFGDYVAKSEGNKILFGCQSFTKTELETVKKMMNSDINAQIVIRDKKLTPEIIDKLILALKK